MCPGVESRVQNPESSLPCTVKVSIYLNIAFTFGTTYICIYNLRIFSYSYGKQYCHALKKMTNLKLFYQSLWSFVEDVIIMHGIKRYLTSPTSVKVDSTQLSKMDQTLFSFMAMFVEHLPVHEVSWNFLFAHLCGHSDKC